MADTKNLCAQIPVALHQRITEEKEITGLTLNQYVEKLITEYYELKKGGKHMATENTRTLAIQISAELMNRLDAYLESKGMKKKPFLTSLIEQVLEDAEKVQLNTLNNETTSAEG